MAQSSHKGILVLLITAFLFALTGVFNRFIPEGIGTFSQLFIRTLFMGNLFLIAGVSLHQITAVKRRDLPLILLRGVLCVGDFSSFFIAVNHLPLGTTLFVFYVGFVLASFLYGAFALHERLTTIKVVSLAAAFVGLLIIYSGGLSSVGNVMAIFALMSGAFFGLETAISKKLSHKYAITLFNTIQYFAAAIISLFLVFVTHETVRITFSYSFFLIFFFFALFSVVAAYTSLYGFKYVEAQKASLILLGEILFVLLIGVLLYQEYPSIQTIVGGIFILTALVLPNIRLGRRSSN